MQAALSDNPDRVNLTLLTLFEGTYTDRGFRWKESLLLFAFNVLVDFASVTVVLIYLQRLEKHASFVLLSITDVVYAALGTGCCAAIAFLSYRLFFGGNTAFFFVLLLGLPICVTLGIGGFMPLQEFILWRFFGKESLREGLGETPWVFAFFGVTACALALMMVPLLWRTFNFSALALVHGHDVVAFPYVLAATTLVPATLMLVALILMLFAKFTAEPARVLPEAYMTFLKEEVGGRQAAGIIMILGILVGTIFGLLWPAT